VPTAFSSYAAQASYMAVVTTTMLREMMVGRAPSRCTSRALASCMISSHWYAPEGLALAPWWISHFEVSAAACEEPLAKRATAMAADPGKMRIRTSSL